MQRWLFSVGSLFIFLSLSAMAQERKSLYFEYTISDQASVLRAHDLYAQITFANGIALGVNGQKTRFVSDETFEESGGGLTLKSSPLSDFIYSFQISAAQVPNDYAKSNRMGFLGYNFSFLSLQLGYGLTQRKLVTTTKSEKSLSSNETQILGEVYYDNFSFFASAMNAKFKDEELDALDSNIATPLTTQSSAEYSGLTYSSQSYGISYSYEKSIFEIQHVQTVGDPEQGPTNSWKARASLELYPRVRATLAGDDQKLYSFSLGCGYKF